MVCKVEAQIIKGATIMLFSIMTSAGKIIIMFTVSMITLVLIYVLLIVLYIILIYVTESSRIFSSDKTRKH